ncbi:MAG TPA: carboxymuconolactone decarboxylase family protein [Bryobacteraceae bacterium]|nr:carboxymuconolactone decarboxylase family protein [Bryobacteraceae bacterium]
MIACSRDGPRQSRVAELTDTVLYADGWERPELSKRDRGDRGRADSAEPSDQLRSHLGIALKNGVTQDELIETITHLAFNAGWPNAVSAIAVAREVLGNN